MTVIITDRDRQQLDERGFFVTGRLFDDAELAPVREAFRRAWDAQIADFESRGVEKSGIVNPSSRPFLPGIRRSEPACEQFCRHPAFAAICRSLLGPDVDLTWDQAVIKPPHTDSAFGWHQDMWYAEQGDYAEQAADPARFRRNEAGITTWAAISDTTIANGTLRVLPGFHRRGLLEHTWSEQTSDWQASYDTSTAEAVELAAGQVIVFRKYLPHASGGNETDEPRMAYQVGYGEAGVMDPQSEHVSAFLRAG